MAFDGADATESGMCFDCGGPAPFIIYLAGEDEAPHEEWACDAHARGHWRCAVVTPSSIEAAPLAFAIDAW